MVQRFVVAVFHPEIPGDPLFVQLPEGRLHRRDIIYDLYLIALADLFFFLYPAQKAFLLQQEFPFPDGAPEIMIRLLHRLFDGRRDVVQLGLHFLAHGLTSRANKHKILTALTLTLSLDDITLTSQLSSDMAHASPAIA